jgi:hypothetical protein
MPWFTALRAYSRQNMRLSTTPDTVLHFCIFFLGAVGAYRSALAFRCHLVSIYLKQYSWSWRTNLGEKVVREKE